MVYEVIGGGWTYRLKPHGRQGRMKVRHFNDLKDATIRGSEIESSDEEVFAEIKRRIPTSRHEGKRQELTQEQGNNKSQAMDKKSQREESEGQRDKQGTALRRSTRKRTTTKRLQLNAVTGKRYTEKEVEIIPEDSESEND